MLFTSSALYQRSYNSPPPGPQPWPSLTPSPFPRILFWTDWDASLPRIEAASMSGAGRRTIHRETGSGGWPNGLTVDYLEKRILWIDARSVPPPHVQRPQASPSPPRIGWGQESQGLVAKRPGQLEPELGRPRAGPGRRSEVRGEAGQGEQM